MTAPKDAGGSATLGEIIEAVRSGQRPAYDDLVYAICALDAMLTFDRKALMRLAEAENECKKPFLSYSAIFQWEESFNRCKAATEKPPKEWVGWNNDPANPEFQKRRAAALKLFYRAAKEPRR